MGRGGAPAREISFVSLVVYGPKVSDSAFAMGVTASETRQGGSQQESTLTQTPDRPSLFWCSGCHLETEETIDSKNSH